jgi:OOP family OmpA-OmpF porin
MKFDEAALFEFDKADLKPEGKEQLNAYREKAKADLSSAEKVRVVGYTDNTGTAEHNSKLSQQRAEVVRDYLVSSGVDPKKLEAIGAADAKPVADNSTKEGQAMNRRVEIEVIGLGK